MTADPNNPTAAPEPVDLTSVVDNLLSRIEQTTHQLSETIEAGEKSQQQAASEVDRPADSMPKLNAEKAEASNAGEVDNAPPTASANAAVAPNNSVDTSVAITNELNSPSGHSYASDIAAPPPSAAVAGDDLGANLDALLDNITSSAESVVAAASETLAGVGATENSTTTVEAPPPQAVDDSVIASADASPQATVPEVSVLPEKSTESPSSLPATTAESSSENEGTAVSTAPSAVLPEPETNSDPTSQVASDAESKQDAPEPTPTNASALDPAVPIDQAAQATPEPRSAPTSVATESESSHAETPPRPPVDLTHQSTQQSPTASSANSAAVPPTKAQSVTTEASATDSAASIESLDEQLAKLTDDLLADATAAAPAIPPPEVPAPSKQEPPLSAVVPTPSSIPQPDKLTPTPEAKPTSSRTSDVPPATSSIPKASSTAASARPVTAEPRAAISARLATAIAPISNKAAEVLASPLASRPPEQRQAAKVIAAWTSVVAVLFWGIVLFRPRTPETVHAAFDLAHDSLPEIPNAPEPAEDKKATEGAKEAGHGEAAEGHGEAKKDEGHGGGDKKKKEKPKAPKVPSRPPAKKKDPKAAGHGEEKKKQEGHGEEH